MRNLNIEQDWVVFNGEYEQFHVYGDNEDYVQDTLILMQKMATKCFKFPFYIHFEGYEDEIESILLKRDTFDIHYQNTGSTVLTMSDLKIFRAEVPCFTVTIPNAETLSAVFAEWFHLAHQNCMWVITQDFNLYYKNKSATIDLSPESITLLADHDAQGFSIITNHSKYQDMAFLYSIFKA